MKLLASLLMIISISVSALQAQPPVTGPLDSTDTDSVLWSGMDELLTYMLLTRDDLRFRDDYTDKDRFRLSIVDTLMAHTLEMLPYTDSSAKVFARFEADPDGVMRHLALAIDISPQSAETFPKTNSSIKFKNLPSSYSQVSEMAQMLSEMQNRIESAVGGETMAPLRQFVVTKYPELILHYVADEDKPLEVLDSLQQLREEYARQFAQMAHMMPEIPLPMIGPLFAVLDDLKSQIAKEERSGKKGSGGYLYDSETPYGRVVIGSGGDDTYLGEYFIIIDPGGNDTYRLSYNPAKPHPCLVADYAGNDTYQTESDFGLASGVFSNSFLVDYAGDDTYRAGNFALGCGYFGVGILWDKSGNDHYFGDTFVQGAGTFGVGLLIDSDGADCYTGNLYCQGFGFTRGIGGIIDFKGNDLYAVQPKYTDILRYDDHYITLSQGFAYGIRPVLSGGFGFIAEYGGNDTYVSDIFGQGSSYWWSLGMLYDKSGNDQYLSYQYAQGAGAHMTVGILLDDSGNDVYRAHGVSQGCGHDFSCGWLIDRRGDDIYSSFDLSQGAGSANGIGIMTDILGNDGWYVSRTNNTQGFGDPRRDYGSIGLFLDTDGDDRYVGNGANNRHWRTPSKWGGGLDRNIPRPDSAEVKK